MKRRFALLQVVFSVIALAAVVWWASRQEAPQFPDTTGAIAWMGAAGLLYALATVVRAERWHRILEITHIHASRADCYGLTCVGYMGNNVLPARAGEVLRVVLMDQRATTDDGGKAGKRMLLGTIVAERIMDLIVLAAMTLVVGFGVLHEKNALPSGRPLSVAAAGAFLLITGLVVLKVMSDRGLLTKLRDLARPLAGAPRALWGKAGIPLLAATVLLWCVEGSVYLAVANAVGLDISATGALYLVGLTNFVAALPAAPGSIGTFDAAVAFGARVLGGSGGLVVSYVLLLRFILYIPITVVGLVVLVTRYGGWARLRDITRLQQTSSA